MKLISRTLFPTLASFGPLFIVLGVRADSTSYLRVLALLGALMTSGALLILFLEVIRLGDARSGTNDK